MKILPVGGMFLHLRQLDGTGRDGTVRVASQWLHPREPVVDRHIEIIG